MGKVGLFIFRANDLLVFYYIYVFVFQIDWSNALHYLMLI